MDAVPCQGHQSANTSCKRPLEWDCLKPAALRVVADLAIGASFAYESDPLDDSLCSLFTNPFYLH